MTRSQLITERDRARQAHKPVRHIQAQLVKATTRQLRAENSSPVHAQLVREIAEGRGC